MKSSVGINNELLLALQPLDDVLVSWVVLVTERSEVACE